MRWYAGRANTVDRPPPLSGQEVAGATNADGRPYVINPDSPEHTYVQLADLIEAEIRAGKLRGKIRAERDLAEECGVAYTTVRRAMAVLRERGLIKSIQGRGTFVVQPKD